MSDVDDRRILDGGLSTQLESMGYDISGPLWTGRALLKQPKVIEEAHRAFVAAGADVLITSSYQVSRAGFRALGLTDSQADAALTNSVRRARAAGRADTIVAASVGPYGAICNDGTEYRGNYGLSESELREFHQPRVDVLVAAGPDYLAIETIPDLREIEALAPVLAQYPSMPCWVTFTARDGGYLWAGQSIEEAALAANSIDNVCRIGINCTAPQYVPELIGRIRSVTTKPVIVYPNAGGVWLASKSIWAGVPADQVAATAVEWAHAGATWIGGCCGTDATAIAGISNGLRAAGYVGHRP